MKSPFDTPMFDLDGEEIRDEKNRPMTLGRLAIRAIDAGEPGQKSTETEQKLDDWDLMLRIRNGKDVTKSEFKYVLKRMGQHYAPGIVGPTVTILNPFITTEPDNTP